MCQKLCYSRFLMYSRLCQMAVNVSLSLIALLKGKKVGFLHKLASTQQLYQR